MSLFTGCYIHHGFHYSSAQAEYTTEWCAGSCFMLSFHKVKVLWSSLYFFDLYNKHLFKVAWRIKPRILYLSQISTVINTVPVLQSITGGILVSVLRFITVRLFFINQNINIPAYLNYWNLLCTINILITTIMTQGVNHHNFPFHKQFLMLCCNATLTNTKCHHCNTQL